jgi:hypothetical protein
MEGQKQLVSARMTASARQWILRVAGFAGLAAFGFFFLLTFSVPQGVETFARDYITQRVAERVDSTLGSSLAGTNEALPEVARRLLERNTAQAELLKARARKLLESALAEIRDPDCACRLRAWRDSSIESPAALDPVNQQLQFFVHGTYLRVVDDLTREVRIFTAINAGAFLLLLIVSFAKPGAARHLFVPGLLLVASSLLCTFLYVFEQNWLLTIVEGSYVGYAYAAWLCSAYLFLCDIALNRGRVTTALGNGAINFLGGAIAALTPC